MELEFYVLILLAAISFVAGFLDSIAGGGGLLMIPSYLIAGLPPHMALGTNKFVATLGTGTAVFNYIRKGKISRKVILFGILFALSGAYIGSRVILFFSPELVGKIIVFLLPIGIIATLYPRKSGAKNESLSKTDFFLRIPLICFTVGFYDGFFGPGTGAFLALGFYVFTKLNLVEATANAKAFNFVSNFGALVAFIISGNIYYMLALPLAATNMLGNYLGSHIAIKKGDRFIKAFLVVVMVILTISLVWKFFVR